MWEESRIWLWLALVCGQWTKDNVAADAISSSH